MLHLQGTRNDSWVAESLRAIDAYRLEKDATGCKKKYFKLEKLNALVWINSVQRAADEYIFACLASGSRVIFPSSCWWLIKQQNISAAVTEIIEASRPGFISISCFYLTRRVRSLMICFSRRVLPGGARKGSRHQQQKHILVSVPLNQRDVGLLSQLAKLASTSVREESIDTGDEQTSSVQLQRAECLFSASLCTLDIRSSRNKSWTQQIIF